MATKYNFSEFVFNKTTELGRLYKCLKIMANDERIDVEFRNKTNAKKFLGKPVVKEVNGQLCVFVLAYEQVKIFSYRGRVIPTTRYKEVAYYIPVCRTIETIKKDKNYK